jgi:hypothetical protein
MVKRSPEREGELIARLLEPDCVNPEWQKLHTELEGYLGARLAGEMLAEAMAERAAAERRLRAEEAVRKRTNTSARSPAPPASDEAHAAALNKAAPKGVRTTKKAAMATVRAELGDGFDPQRFKDAWEALPESRKFKGRPKKLV